MNSGMVELKDLRFEYNGFRLHADLSVAPGEILSLLGPNGSGKTTLLKCVSGLLTPQTPCVFVDGVNLHKVGHKEKAKLLGYVPQSHHPGFAYTVLEFVVMGRTAHIPVFGIPGEKDYGLAMDSLKRMGLEKLANRPTTRISGGQLQLALIARALVCAPRVLIMDEPTAHLDFKNQLKILRTVRKIASEKSIAVIIALHDPNHAAMYSDRIALLKEGCIHCVGHPDSVLNEKNLHHLYGVKVQVKKLERFRFVLPADDEI